MTADIASGANVNFFGTTLGAQAAVFSKEMGVSTQSVSEIMAAFRRMDGSSGETALNLTYSAAKLADMKGLNPSVILQDMADAAGKLLEYNIQNKDAFMQQAVSIPVTVKNRIGIDDQDKYEDLKEFVQIVAEFGCQRFTVHARKAWLKGLSPKENRTIPPLRYEDVYRLKTDFPQLFIEINGGIRAIAEIQSHLQQVDAVMIGRVAYENPYFLATVDRDIYGEKIEPLTRAEIVRKMLPYTDEWTSRGLKLHAVSRHLLTLFNLLVEFIYLLSLRSFNSPFSFFGSLSSSPVILVTVASAAARK
jgi:hypothetical protein